LGLLETQEGVKQRLESAGFPPASKELTSDNILSMLRLNLPQVMPVRLNREQYASRLRRAKQPVLLNRFKHLLTHAVEGENEGGNMASNVAQVRFLDSAERLVQYEVFLSELTVRVLGVDDHVVARDVSLISLGLDSVTGMMMLNIIERSTGFKLENVVLLSADVSVASIAQALDAAAAKSSN
jgi:aryl carrier-like protein